MTGINSALSCRTSIEAWTRDAGYPQCNGDGGKRGDLFHSQKLGSFCKLRTRVTTGRRIIWLDAQIGPQLPTVTESVFKFLCATFSRRDERLLEFSRRY